jgi:hypothetical protein
MQGLVFKPPPTVYGTPSPASAMLRGGMRSAGDPPVGMHGITPKCEPQQWVEATAAAAPADRGPPRVGFSPMRQADGPPCEKRVVQSSQTSGAMAAAAGNGSVWVTRTVNRPVVASGRPDPVRATVADMGPSLPLAEAALRGRPRLVIRPTMQTG